MSGCVFVDTSAFHAVLDADDRFHERAAHVWGRLLDSMIEQAGACLTHSGVVIETSALVQRRLGMAAVRALHDRMLPLVDVTWIDRGLHARAVSALLASGRSDVSLVDWVSFEVMRENALTDAFAFDDDFADQGFTLLR